MRGGVKSSSSVARASIWGYTLGMCLALVIFVAAFIVNLANDADLVIKPETWLIGALLMATPVFVVSLIGGVVGGAVGALIGLLMNLRRRVV